MSELLSTFKIGDARVTTEFPSETVQPGQEVDLKIEVTGGDSEQDCSGIKLGVAATFVGEKENPYSEHAPPEFGEVTEELEQYELVPECTVGPDETEMFETTVQLPNKTPLTRGDVLVTVETGLAINWSVDPDKGDALTVEPTSQMEYLFDALEELGFVYRQNECSRDQYRGFRQEFEFDPSRSHFAAEMDELLLRCVPSESGLHIELLPTQGMWTDDTMAEKWTKFEFDAGDFEDDEEAIEAMVEKLESKLSDSS